MPGYDDEDSWGRLLRDVLLRLGAAGAVGAGVAWYFQLPVQATWARLTATPAPALTRAPAPEPTRAPRAKAPAPETTAPTQAPRAEARAPASPAPTRAPQAKASGRAPVKVAAVQSPAPVAAVARAAGGHPVTHGGVQHQAMRVAGVPLQVVTVDLFDPHVVGTVVLANKAAKPNSADATSGDEAFEKIVARTRAAVAINGTFFSKDAQKRVMGNVVRDGALIKFSRWDHDGTTFWLGPDNRPGMCTPKTEGDAPWDKTWLAISCGPRLLRKGYPWLQPAEEGFKDDHVLGVAGRTALGFDQSGQHLRLVSFEAGVDLAKEATVMRALGCTEAMNLDGGASRSLAVGGHVVVPAGRALTNVLAFYDQRFPAPSALTGAFRKFR